MQITISADTQDARTCLALAFLLTCTSLVNSYIYPLLPEVLFYSREVWTYCSVGAILSIALVAYQKPSFVRKNSWFILSAALSISGLFAVAFGMNRGSSFLLAVGTAACGLGDAWFAVLAGMSLAKLGVKKSSFVIPCAFLFNWFLMFLFSRINISFEVALLLYGICNIGIYLLIRPYVSNTLSAIRSTESPAELGLTNPSSFLPLSHPILICVVLFNAAYGFALIFQQGETFASTAWRFIPPLICLILVFAYKKSFPADGLFRTASFLVLAASMFLPLSLGYQLAETESNLFFVLLHTGSTCFSLLMYFLIASLGARNELGSLVFSATITGLAWLGISLGAISAMALESFTHDITILLRAAGIISLVLVFYNFIVLRLFSFEKTVLGIQPVILPKQVKVPNNDEDFSTQCQAVAEQFKLTKRESEIFELLVRGRSVPVIREKLFLSHNTVKTHVRHIYAKTGIHSQQELIDLVETTPKN